jgi:integrase
LATLQTQPDSRNGGFKAWAKMFTVVNGKKKRPRVYLGRFRSLRDAQREFTRIEDTFSAKKAKVLYETQESRQNSPVLRVIFSEYISTWRGSVNSLRNANICIKNISSRLGDLKIVDITPTVIERYISARLEDFKHHPKGLSGRRTINIEVNTLSATMEWALKNGMLDNHPFKTGARRLSSYHLKIAEKSPTVLTQEEVKAMIIAMRESPHDLTVFLGYLCTGMRKSELNQLTWAMVDPEARVIRFCTPKTGKQRVIHYLPQFEAVLLRLRNQWPGMKQWKPRKPEQMNYVFCDKMGRPFTWNLGLFIPRMARKLGLRHIHIHCCRHTYATRMAPFVSAFELQQNLGHASVTTSQRYIHLAGISESIKPSLTKASDLMGLSGEFEAKSVPVSVPTSDFGHLALPEIVEK